MNVSGCVNVFVSAFLLVAGRLFVYAIAEVCNRRVSLYWIWIRAWSSGVRMEEFVIITIKVASNSKSINVECYWA